jgi:sulfur-carrier protein
MVTVEFAPSLQRHKPCPVQQVAAGTLAQTLDAAFAAEPGLRHYVLDDQGHIRKHVAVFINRDMHLQRQQLHRPLHNGDKVLVIQCLTGG